MLYKIDCCALIVYVSFLTPDGSHILPPKKIKGGTLEISLRVGIVYATSGV